MDEDIPVFGGTTVPDVSSELRKHTSTTKYDHKADHVFVTTRNKARRKRRTYSREGPVADEEALALQERDELWTEIEEFDAVDIERAQEPGIDSLRSQVAPPQEDLPGPLNMEEIAEEQRVDDFCQTVLTRRSESRDSAFFEDHQGVLKREQPYDPAIIQVMVPQSLRARLLRLCHDQAIAGHLGQNCMYHAL